MKCWVCPSNNHQLSYLPVLVALVARKSGNLKSVTGLLPIRFQRPLLTAAQSPTNTGGNSGLACANSSISKA
jgi:hypothetical protein